MTRILRRGWRCLASPCCVTGPSSNKAKSTSLSYAGLSVCLSVCISVSPSVCVSLVLRVSVWLGGDMQKDVDFLMTLKCVTLSDLERPSYATVRF